MKRTPMKKFKKKNDPVNMNKKKNIMCKAGDSSSTGAGPISTPLDSTA